MKRTDQLRHLTLAVVAIILLAAATTAEAGDFRHDRKGLVMGLSLGGANAELQYDRNGSTINREIEGGSTGGILIGFGLNDHLVLGVEAHGFRTLDSVEETEVGLGAVSLTWYPGGGGFFLRGGVGSSLTTLRLGAVEDVDWVEREADAALFGLGYEWRLGRQFALGLGVDAYVSEYEDLPRFQDTTFGFGSASLKLNWYL